MYLYNTRHGMDCQHLARDGLTYRRVTMQRAIAFVVVEGRGMAINEVVDYNTSFVIDSQATAYCLDTEAEALSEAYYYCNIVVVQHLLIINL